MSAHAPDYIENEDERELYREISRTFENYCGEDESLWQAKAHSFINVAQSGDRLIEGKTSFGTSN